MDNKELKKLYPRAYEYFYGDSNGTFVENHVPEITWDLGSIFTTYELYFDGELIGGYKQDDIREHIFPKVERILKRRPHYPKPNIKPVPTYRRDDAQR